MHSPPASEPPLIGSQAIISNAELESMRRHTIRVLGSVVAALEAAGHQRQTLLADVHAAQQRLQVLANEREMAEASLAASRAELSASQHSRAALAAEIAALEGRRCELARAIERSPIPIAQPSTAVPIQLPNWPFVIRSVRTYVVQFFVDHPIHPAYGNVATGSLIALFLAMALLVSPVTRVFGGVQLLAVTSGSMEPAIPTGSLVAIRPVPASSLKVGDVITFANPSAPDVLVTHRVVSLEARDGQTVLTTKGDANDSADGLLAPANRAVGRVDLALPWLGDLMIWLGSPVAKIASICLAVLALGLSAASIQRSTKLSLLDQ